jgi:hypothetical protein
MLPFNDSGFEAKLRRTDRGNITAWPAADDEDVVGSAHAPQTFYSEI